MTDVEKLIELSRKATMSLEDYKILQELWLKAVSKPVPCQNFNRLSAE